MTPSSDEKRRYSAGDEKPTQSLESSYPYAQTSNVRMRRWRPTWWTFWAVLKNYFKRQSLMETNWKWRIIASPHFLSVTCLGKTRT